MSIPSSSDAVATSARSVPALQSRLRVEPLLFRQAAVVRCDRLFAEPIAEMPRDTLRHPPGVYEDERRAVGTDQCGQPIVVLLPHLLRHHRIQGRARDFDIQIHPAAMSLVDDRSNLPRLGWRRAGTARPRRSVSALRRARAADSGRSAICCNRSSESDRCAPRRVPMTAWISSTMTVRTVRSMCRLRSAVSRRYKRLGRGHQDVRRRAQHRRPFGCGRITGANRRGDYRGRDAALLRRARRIPRRGSARFLWISALSAFSGET